MSAPKKAKYKYNYKKHSRFVIEPNQRGFICSCNNREKDCVKESYNILNKYADILYKKTDVTEENQSEDISDDLTAELNELKNNKEIKPFQQVESGAKNILFIKTTLENPIELAHKIVEDINETKQQQTKFLIRLVPIETTCKANIADLEKAFKPLLEKHFKSTPKTFSIVFNHRNNDSLKRDDVIKLIGDMVAVSGEHKVNLKSAEVSIVIEVIRSWALVGVVPDFLKYKKYNLIVASDQEGGKNPESGEKAEECENQEGPEICEKKQVKNEEETN